MIGANGPGTGKPKPLRLPIDAGEPEPGSVRGNDMDELAETSTTLKTHVAVDSRIQCIVLPPAYVQSRLQRCTSLANQDGTSQDKLAVVTLHSQSL